MNRDDIIRMAREAGWQYADGDEGYEPLLERFAALVATAEREACAKACEKLQLVATELSFGPYYDRACVHCAKTIRARGQE